MEHKLSEVRDLQTLLAVARQADAERSSSEAAQIAVIRILANAGGALPISELRTRYGVSDQTIAYLCDEEQHKDKRKKVRARVGEIDGQPVCWLTASGQQAAGKSRGQEIRPTSATLWHSLAPSRLSNWLTPLSPQFQRDGVEVGVSWGAPCYEFSKRVEALAWARLKSFADPSGSLGLLTGGLIPDALLTERRPLTAEGESHFAYCWGEKPSGLDELAETTLAVEFQQADRQAGAPLLHKVACWSVAIENLKVASRVLWIVEEDAAKVLAGLGVGDPSRRSGQHLIPAHLVGMSSKLFQVSSPDWWVTNLTRG